MSIAITADTTEVDRGYENLRGRVQARFAANLEAGAGVLFTTDAAGLWEAYLDAFDSPSHRQYHTCHACRRFIETYGGLVVIGEDGRTRPAIWDEADAPEHYRPAIAAMARIVSKAKVTGVFYSEATVWGTPTTPTKDPNTTWTHFAVTPDPAIVHRDKLKTAFQAMAEKKEDFANVGRALGEFSLALLDRAVLLLESDALYRAEKVIGPAKWLRDLHKARQAAKGEGLARNVVWRAVALAPSGFCHPRSSMVGTLLDDLAAGMDFGDASRRFAAKMHPLQYQRPQAAPSAGNIAEAEKIVERLGIARSLERRFARLDEIEAFWRPKAEEPTADAPAGVFSHLKPKGQRNGHPDLSRVVPPPMTVTWRKFAETVLPNAKQLEVLVPFRSHFAAIVTAVHDDAPPILQWDREEARNPFSWYLWHGGSPAVQWGLATGSWCKVAAITSKPSQWRTSSESGPAFSHQGESVILILDGARESRTDAGAALFPEILKSELRAIRSTIEAYSRKATLAGQETASACGLLLGKGEGWNVTVRAYDASGAYLDYRLDRWD